MCRVRTERIRHIVKDVKTNKSNDLSIILKGFIIGSSMSVPGVSGGTMAILLGIYDKLISAISNFLKDIKGNIIFLVKFCVGAGLGIGSLAFVIKYLLEKFPFPISFFFLGAVIGGLPALYQKTKVSKINISFILYFLLGLGSVLSLGFLKAGDINLAGSKGIMYVVSLLIVGIIIALALVLPGISTSHMLLVLGMYDTMLAAITELDVIYIGTLGIATVIGVFLITKPLEWTMNRFPYQTYCIIIGFVIGSTWEIFKEKIIPAVPNSAGLSWWLPWGLISCITFVLGYHGIKYLSRFSED